MSIRLYRKPLFKGDEYRVTGDLARLKNTPVKNGSSSLRMTQNSDRAAFFKKKEYRGGVMFRSGTWGIAKLGAPTQGGKLGFGNTLSSVRITPFGINVHVNVIQDDDGNYPGGVADRGEMESLLDQIFAKANLDLEQALFRLDRRSTVYRRSSKFFEMKNEAFQLALKGRWRKSKHLNVFFIDDMSDALGMQIACGGRLVVLTHNQRDGVDAMGNTLAHEFGHFAGLSHRSADLDRDNLMQGPGKGSNWWVNRTDLSGRQIEEMHKKLSKNITKKVVRVE